MTGQNGMRPLPSPAKLQRPIAADGVVVRSRLLERLTTSREPVVLIEAGPGYGKTTLLSQWADVLPAVAHLRLDQTDDDPIVLLGDLFDAVSTVATLRPSLRGELRSPAELTGFEAPARFTEALWGIDTPIVLMLDDVHLVSERTATDWLSWILTRLPPGMRVVLAMRSSPSVPVGQGIAAGAVLWLRHDDLRLARDEVLGLASGERVAMSAEDVDRLVAETAGWPVAAHLAIRALRTDRRPLTSAMATRGVTAYMRSELLDRLDDDTRSWVLRSAVLDELTGPLCDAALDTSGSLRRLRSLETENVLLYPLDEARTTYRYHHLYREFLRAELEAWLPGEGAAVAERAARWLEHDGRVAQAVQVARRATDPDLAAGLVGRHAFGVFWRGGLATASEWLSAYDADGVRERYASIAVLGALAEMIHGETGRAMRWLSAAQRSTDARPMPDGAPSKEPWVAAARAYMMPSGPDVFADDVQAALDGVPEGGFLGPPVRILAVVRELVMGRDRAAEAVAVETARSHESVGAMPGLVMLRGLIAHLMLGRGDLSAARGLVRETADMVAGTSLDDYLTSALLYAAGARIAAGDRRTSLAQELLGRVNRMRPLATAAIPWYAVLVRSEAIHAALLLGESAQARILAEENEAIVRNRPGLGAIGERAMELRRHVEGRPTIGPGGWELTKAERRVLAYLPSRLSFAEIAERLGVSTHTVKSHGMSIYGKLGASSRSQAIERAVDVHLLDVAVLHWSEPAISTADRRQESP